MGTASRNRPTNILKSLNFIQILAVLYNIVQVEALSISKRNGGDNPLVMLPSVYNTHDSLNANQMILLLSSESTNMHKLARNSQNQPSNCNFWIRRRGGSNVLIRGGGSLSLHNNLYAITYDDEMQGSPSLGRDHHWDHHHFPIFYFNQINIGISKMELIKKYTDINNKLINQVYYRS